MNFKLCFFIVIAICDFAALSLYENAINQLNDVTVNNNQVDCVQSTLGPFLDQCHNKGMDSLASDDRKNAALLLTLCEMNTLKLMIPEPCNDISYIDECVVTLEKIPQYWSHFTGNYREIHKLCHEISAPTAKDHILKVYQNITHIMFKLHGQVHTSFDMNQEAQDKLHDKINDVFTLIKSLTDVVTQSQQSTQEQFNKYSDHIHYKLENSLELLLTFTAKEQDLREVAVNLAFLKADITDLVSTFDFDSITQKVESMKTKVNHEFIMVEEMAHQLSTKLTNKFSSIDTILETSGIKEDEVLDKITKSNTKAQRLLESMDSVEKAVNGQRQYFDLERESLVHTIEQMFQQFYDLYNVLEDSVDNYTHEVESHLQSTLQLMKTVNGEISKLSTNLQPLSTLVAGIQKGFKTMIFQVISLKHYATRFLALPQLQNVIALCQILGTSVVMVMAIKVSKSFPFNIRLLLLVLLMIVTVTLVQLQSGGNINNNGTTILPF